MRPCIGTCKRCGDAIFEDSIGTYVRRAGGRWYQCDGPVARPHEVHR